MPMYEIQHTLTLTASQQDDLAVAITDIHSTLFTTPKMFVQIKYQDVRAATTYIGGKRRAGNHIIAHVRQGPTRTQKDWDRLVAQLVEAWNRIVPLPRIRRSAEDGQEDSSLRSCVVLGGLIGGWEAGFVLPQAGGDVEWLREHWDEFQLKADGGDEDFKDLVEEVTQRGLLTGAGKTPKQRLEEMLGWGDSA